jgi:hypothetical protein
MDFTKDLNMKEVSAKMALKNLSSTHQMWRKEIWPRLSARLLEELSLLENILTGDETCVF